MRYHAAMAGSAGSVEAGQRMQRHERLEQLLDGVSDLVCQLDAAGRITWANRALARLMSLSPSGLAGRSAFDLVHPDDLSEQQERVRSELRDGADSFELQCRVAGADGTVANVEWSVSVHRTETGEIEGLDAIGRDVTVSRQTALEARRWRDQLDAVLHAVPFPLFAKDRAGRYLLCNPAFERFFGKRMTDMVGRTVWQCWPSEDAQVFHERDIALMEEGTTQVYDHRLSDVAGQHHDVVFSKACFRDRTGAVGGLVGTVVDVTERHRAEAEAREAYALLQGAIEQTSTGILIVEASSGEIVRFNRAASQLLGVDELTGARPAPDEWLVVEDGSRLTVDDLPSTRVLKTGQEIEAREMVVLRPGYEPRWLLIGAAPVRDLEGEIVAAIVTFVDVTERRLLLEAISRGKEEWERTFDTVRELIVVCDSDGRVVRANRAVSDRLGIAPPAVVGRFVDEVLVGPAGEATGYPLLSAIQTGRSTELGIRSSSIRAELQVSVSPRIGADGRAEGAIVVARDVTAERHAERIRQQHLVVQRDEETLRTFRHELGNVLNTLQTTFSTLERHYETFTADKRLVYMQRCRESLDLAGHLHASLAKYQQLERLDLKPVNLSAFLNEKAYWLFERAEEAGCRCRFEPCETPITVLADRQAVLRIVLNLIDNAVAAVAQSEIREITLACQSGLEHGSVTVRDTGCGVPPQLTERVMTPLFTTKPAGSGMGLTIVQKLMVRMGGLVELTSVPGHGTAVELRFPRVSEATIAPRRSLR